jgi:GT2 family glycosyltransferase
MFGVAVNYFSTKDHPPSVKESARFAVALLKNCPEVTSIILVDGSAERDPELQNYCESINIKYEHCGKTMSFAEAYNYGVSMLPEEWICTMASDIYVFPDTFTKFRNFIEKYPNLSIGCIIPYLSRCDLPLQRTSQASQRFNCYFPIMSFNLNIFPRHIFKEIGGLSHRYSGNFNDIDTTIKLKKLGLSVFLVDTYVHHYGRLTLRHGTNVNARSDWEQFYNDYPELKCDSDLWNLRLDYFLIHPMLKFIYQVTHRSNLRIIRSKSMRKSIVTWIYEIIPRWQKIDH